MNPRLASCILLFTALSGLAQAPVFPLIPRNYSMAEIPKGGQRQLELSKARAAASRQSIALPPQTSNVMLITWPTNVGTTVIEKSTDLLNWKPIATNSLGRLTVTNEFLPVRLIASYMTRINANNMNSIVVGGLRLYYSPGYTFFRGFVFGTTTQSTNTKSVTLVWDKSSDPSVTSYKVVYGSNGPLNYTNSASVKGVSATIPNLIPGLTYYFSAVACNADGESDFSNEISYTPGAALKTEPFKLSIRKL